MVSSLACNRQRRGLWLTSGYPWSVTNALAAARRAATLAKFKADVGHFDKLKALEEKTTAQTNVVRRHVCNKVMVKQLIVALKDEHLPDFNKCFDTILRKRIRVASGTQVIEDIIGTMKSCRRLKLTKKFSRPERGMGLTLKHNVLTKRHRYKTPSHDVPIGSKTLALPPTAFRAKVASRSLPFQEVVSSDQKASYYSPKAENFSVNCADLSLLRAVAPSNYDLTNVWLGEFCHVSHRLVIGGVQGATLTAPWFHALLHFDQSSCILWPGTIKKIGTSEYFEHDLERSEPFVHPLLTLDKVEAYSISWPPLCVATQTVWPTARGDAACFGLRQWTENAFQ